MNKQKKQGINKNGEQKMLKELQESFTNAIQALKGQKLRSALTLLGISIGIIAIVTLISVGNGVNKSVTQQFEQMGSNTLMVTPGKGTYGTFFVKLDKKDPEIIEKIQGIELVIPIYIKATQAEFSGEKKTAMIIGINPDDQEGLKKLGMINLIEGRELNNSDNYSIIIGKKFKENLFETNISLRHKINIEEYGFRVIGSIGSTSPIFGAMYDSAIIMNKKTLEKIYPETTPSRIIVKTINNEKNEEIKEKIINELKKSHGQEDFKVMSSEKIMDTAQSVLGLIQLILIAIAAIALIVGGIGIMNTMLMTVIERTNEIGLMKAIGATKTQILTQFITEAAIIGLIGGTIGTIIGLGFAVIVSIISENAGMPLKINISIELIFGAMLFAIIVGIISGFIPAQRAANLDPVDALRYE
jgi:putative ABC transport system permease protein